MAEQVKGLYLPVTPYSSVHHTFDRPGSVDVAEDVGALEDFRAYLDALKRERRG